jgi:NAD(P)H-dependent flavin oxidoreductase YrpB (nitropropane dioxygenase family)
MQTSFTRLVGCRHPLQLAGMGAVGSVELASAVTAAGGLGTAGVAGLPAELVATLLDQAARPLAANFLTPFLDPAAVEAAASRVRVVEFFYGDPDGSLVDLVHAGGALASWQVGSLEEARRAADAGCDYLTAQGTEAGGHVRGKQPLPQLLAEVLQAVSVPVVAAGGIATAQQVAGLLADGAAGVRVGTRFLVCPEADVHPAYVEALLAADGDDTVLTEAFGVGWPDAPHRVLRDSAERARAGSSDVVGTLQMGPVQVPVPRLSTLPPTRTAEGDVAAMAMYAGIGVGHVTRVQSVAEVVDDLMREVSG